MLTGTELVAVVHSIVAALNSTGVVSIPDMWSAVMHKLAEDKAEQVLQLLPKMCLRAGTRTHPSQ